MFGWFKKQSRPEDTEAYKQGKRMVESMTADLQQFMSTRFDPVFDGYVGALTERFETVYDNDEAPPIILARIEFDIFNDHVRELREKMGAEVNAAMREWLETADLIGGRSDFQKLIDTTIGSFQDRLTMTGLQAFIDRADDLKVADDKWRKANPERAAQFPADPS
jgi:hypothetical protein